MSHDMFENESSHGNVFKVFLAISIKYGFDWNIIHRKCTEIDMSPGTFRSYKKRLLELEVDVRDLKFTNWHQRIIAEAQVNGIDNGDKTYSSLFDQLVDKYGMDWDQIRLHAISHGISNSTFRSYKKRYLEKLSPDDQSIDGILDIIDSFKSFDKATQQQHHDNVSNVEDESVAIQSVVSGDACHSGDHFEQLSEPNDNNGHHSTSMLSEQTERTDSISWRLIPRYSILERTPRGLFNLSPSQDNKFVKWLEKLPAEMIFAGSLPPDHILVGLDLLSVSSCSLSWLLGHCGKESLMGLLNELKRIISECIGIEATLRTDIFSMQPIISEKLLYHLVENQPPGASGLLTNIGNECRENDLYTSITEATILETCGFTADSLLAVAMTYTLASPYQKAIKDIFSPALNPLEFESFGEFMGVWLEKHLNKAESTILLMHEGWAGEPVRVAEIAKQIQRTTQNIYRILNLADQKLSSKKSNSEVQELALGIFAELYKAGGVLTGEELGAALHDRYEWDDKPSEVGLVRILKRINLNGITYKNGWFALTSRTCLSESAKSNDYWTYFYQELTPIAALHPPQLPEKAVKAIQKAPPQQLEITPEPLELLLPEDGGDAVILPEWIDSEDFAWLVAGAILSRAEQRQLCGPKKVWSVAELQLSEQDYTNLRSWARIGSFNTRNLSKRIRVGKLTFSGREALALFFIVYAAEIGRRDATEGELWSVVYEGMGSNLKDFLMMHLSFANVGPRPWLRSELEKVLREYNLRHAFDGAGTQAWIKSIYLQFGFTQKGLNRLPWWLCGQQMPVAVHELLNNGPNFSASFTKFWQAIKEFRWKGIAAEEFQQVLRETAWLPPTGIADMMRAATSKIHLASQDGTNDIVEGNESASLLGRPRLSIIEGKPVFFVPLGDIWPESLKESSYVLAFDRLIRVSVERQNDGSYSLPAGDIAIEPVKASLSVMLYSGGSPVFDESVRYELWNEEEEFSFYRANGCTIPEERVKTDGSPLYIICSADIVCSSPADMVSALFSGAARLHYFKRGLPAGFALSIEGEPFWNVPDQAESKSKSGAVSVKPIQAACMPIPCTWGSQAQIRLSGIPEEFKPRRLLIGEMRLHMAENGKNSCESEKFTVAPGLVALPAKGTMIGLVRGELRRVSISIISRFTGVALESAAGWTLPDSRKTLDKADLKTSRILAIPSNPPNLNEWGFTEGERFLARPSLNGDHIGQELIGLGAPLYFRCGPYNSVENPIEVSRSVIDRGVFIGTERTDKGWSIGLRHELELTDMFAIHAWYPDEPFPVILKPSEWHHDCPAKCIVVAPSTTYFDDPCSIAISFAGKCIGRTWCGGAAFHDFSKIIWDTPQWKETAAWLAWWHAPVLMQEIRRAVADRVRSQASETLIAWLGLSNGKMSPPCMTDVTIRMKDAIRTFFHDQLPDADKSAEVLQSLQLVSGDWDFDEDDAWEGYDFLLEVSPVLLSHLALTGLNKIYGDKPQRSKDLLGLLRRRIAGLRELDSDSDIVDAERSLLSTAARVMGVDDQFINRSLLDEARKLLRSEKPNLRNLEYCLDIQPLRDWIALRLLA